jgi:sigma-B regulation protein RsbU (phosphoserine phosphatase)
MIGLKPDITALVAQREIHLQTGEGLVLYTDGITEAENEQGEPYGLPRLCQQVSQVWQLPAIGIQQAVINDVRQFMGSQRLEDDITLVVLKKS